MNLRVFYLYKTVGFGWLRTKTCSAESFIGKGSAFAGV